MASGYRQDPEDEDRETVATWVVSTAVGLAVVGLLGYFGNHLNAATGLTFFNSTIFVLLVAFSVAGAVEVQLKKRQN